MTDAAHICLTCATQYPPAPAPPDRCAICEDERQYVHPRGQLWTTLDALRETHTNSIEEHEVGLTSIHTQPEFGINQRAFLIQTPDGNLLWDCVALLDDATIEHVRDLGGVRAIAISHPHYYSTMIEWSRAFGDAPIHLHEADRPWVMRPDPAVRYWSSEAKDLFGGLTLVRLGGHFEGYQVAHWPGGAEGRGALMSGDLPQVCADRKSVGFMYSYPNYIPLGPGDVRHIESALAPLAFDRIYGAFPYAVISGDAKAVVHRSIQRHLGRIET